MHAQPFGQPPPGTQYYDPQASTAAYPPQPAPAPPQLSLRGLRTLAALAAACAFVALAIALTGFRVTPSGMTTQDGRLQSQVTGLQRQVTGLQHRLDTLGGQYATLKAAQGKTAGQVSAITAAGVLNFKPFANHVCQVTAQAPGGRPYNTGVACNG